LNALIKLEVSYHSFTREFLFHKMASLWIEIPLRYGVNLLSVDECRHRTRVEACTKQYGSCFQWLVCSC
jgi:hypothetical protein